MASRQDRKETARQARRASEQAAARAAQRRRIGTLAGVGVVAVIVAVVAIVLSSAGPRQGGIQTGTTASATETTVERELRGIPQHGLTLGRSSAPLTIEYFGDLECPVCQALTLGDDGGGLPQLIDGPVRHGQIKLVYKSLETATGHVNANRWYPQQDAAYAAGEQNRFWQYAELFYREQGSEEDRYVTEGYLAGLARQVPGLNLSRWMADRGASSLTAQVKADGQLAIHDGLQGTPSLVVVGSQRDALVPGVIPTYTQIMATVNAVS